MSESLSILQLRQLNAFVSAWTGLHFPPERTADLQRGIAAAAQEFGFASMAACATWLLATELTQSQIEILASHLTVGETFFFREPKTFQVLETQVFPELIRSRRECGKHLRIWSAGCASGEEPYSIAITLHRLIPDLKDWQILVLATDINPRALRKADHGVFGQWSFRGAPEWLKQRYFTPVEKNRFKITSRIREMVTFAHLNLAEDSYPARFNHTSGMDMIFCRNVLMYFAPDRAAEVLEKLHASLADDGWFIGSATENFGASRFQPVPVSGVTLYRKRSAPADETARSESDAGKTTALNFPTSSPQMVAGNLPAQPPEIVFPPEAETPTASPAEHARALANQGRLGEALAVCDRALATDKLNTACHYLRATILQEQGSLTEAETALKRALYLDHKFVLALFTLGNLLLQQHREREARKHFEHAFQLLRAYDREDVLPESEGMTAGRLAEILTHTISAKPPEK